MSETGGDTGTTAHAICGLLEQRGLLFWKTRSSFDAAVAVVAAALRKERERCALIAERFNIPTMVTSMSHHPMTVSAPGPVIAAAIRLTPRGE